MYNASAGAVVQCSEDERSHASGTGRCVCKLAGRAVAAEGRPGHGLRQPAQPVRMLCLLVLLQHSRFWFRVLGTKVPRYSEHAVHALWLTLACMMSSLCVTHLDGVRELELAAGRAVLAIASQHVCATVEERPAHLQCRH